MKVIQERVSVTGNLKAFASLIVAVLALSWIAIFYRFLEEKIGPFATAFHRVWLATILLGLWNGLQYLKDQFDSDKSVKQNPYTPLVLLQLLVAGMSFAGNQCDRAQLHRSSSQHQQAFFLWRNPSVNNQLFTGS